HRHVRPLVRAEPFGGGAVDPGEDRVIRVRDHGHTPLRLDLLPAPGLECVAQDESGTERIPESPAAVEVERHRPVLGAVVPVELATLNLLDRLDRRRVVLEVDVDPGSLLVDLRECLHYQLLSTRIRPSISRQTYPPERSHTGSGSPFSCL